MYGSIAFLLMGCLLPLSSAFLPPMLHASIGGARTASYAHHKSFKMASPSPLVEERPSTIQRYHNSWTWRGHKINYKVEGQGPPLLLIHGFGASVNHYRKQFAYLPKQGYKVYAIDLLGFGGSDKPSSVEVYELELWRDQVVDFMKEVEGDDAKWTVMGNSIGGLLSLMVSAAVPQSVRGCVLFNSAGGMVSFRDEELPWFWKPIWIFFRVVIFGDVVGPYLFQKFRTEENVREILSQVYRNPSAVDDELIKILCEPGQDEGAEQVFLKVLRGPAGPSPEQTLPKVECPILAIWGEEDPWTPMDKGLHPGINFHKYNPKFRLCPLPNTGHCPHDERPEEVHKVLMPFLSEIHS